MNVKTEMITKEIATRYFSNRNPCQRHISKKRVGAMVSDMENGRWADSNDAIAFDKNGYLINGQHRMLAVINSGVPQRFLVVRGLDDHAFSAMDKGVKRSARHQLEVLGHSADHAQSFMRIAKQIYKNNIVPNHVLLSVVEKYEEASRDIPHVPCTNYTSALKAVLILGRYHGIPAERLRRVREVIQTMIAENPKEWAIMAWVKYRLRIQFSSYGERKSDWVSAQRVVRAIDKGEVLKVLRPNMNQKDFYVPSID